MTHKKHSAAQTARVVESFGRRAIVSTDTGERWPAVVFGKRLHVVCGDYVRLAMQPGSDEWQIVAIESRSTVLARMDSRGRSEPLVANVTLLAVLTAAEPTPDLYMIDRYLAGAAYAGIRGVVIINKTDLAYESEMLGREYRGAGYTVIAVSALTGQGLVDLEELMRSELTLLVGQSGVGKSTLCNALVPTAARPTRTLSAATGEGTHTTVAAVLLELPGGGELIDSPGVRDFAPAPVAETTVQTGWPEIMAVAPRCRFNDCLHLREPGCAVHAAIESGTISSRRYESYKRLINLMRQLVAAHERPRA